MVFVVCVGSWALVCWCVGLGVGCVGCVGVYCVVSLYSGVFVCVCVGVCDHVCACLFWGVYLCA